jgi:hypothetical protein
MTQVTAQIPFLGVLALGETSHDPEFPPVPMIKIEASVGRLLTVPFHLYKRPGGGGWNCSSSLVMATLTEVDWVVVTLTDVGPPL